MRHLLIALTLAVLASTTTPVRADVENAVVIRTHAPPLDKPESVPVARTGYAWSPGFWDWRGTRYVWMKGEWIREKPGFRWEAWRWVEDGGRWFFVRGRYAPVKSPSPIVAQR